MEFSAGLAPGAVIDLAAARDGCPDVHHDCDRDCDCDCDEDEDQGPGAVLEAALLAGPRGSALGGWSALAFDGLPDGFGAPVRLVIPAHARRPRLPGVRVAWSTQLGEEWVGRAARPRRTRPGRSLVDEAAWSPGPAVARDVLLRGLGSGAVEPAELAAALRARGPCRHRRVIDEVLAAVGRGPLPSPAHPLAAARPGVRAGPGLVRGGTGAPGVGERGGGGPVR
jgi:hypothetical protein